MLLEPEHPYRSLFANVQDLIAKMKKKVEAAGETAIQVFNSEKFGTVRTAGTVEDPLFCLADVCKALGLQTTAVTRRLDKGVISKHPLPTSGGNQVANFVNEDGLYDVILDSRKPEAKAFRKWVTSEVLPAIRKTGGYIAARADESPEQIMARALKVADETLRRQKAVLDDKQFQLDTAHAIIEAQDEELASKDRQIRRLVPFADYARTAIECSTATYTMTDTADFLGFARVADFMDWCVRLGVLRRLNGRWMPTKEYLGQGYFSTRVYRKVVSADYYEETHYTVVTEAGRKMLFDLMSDWTNPSHALAEPATVIGEGGAL